MPWARTGGGGGGGPRASAGWLVVKGWGGQVVTDDAKGSTRTHSGPYSESVQTPFLSISCFDF